MSEMYAFGAIGVLAAVAGARGSRTVAEPPPPGPGWITTRTLVSSLHAPPLWRPSRRRPSAMKEELRREAWWSPARRRDLEERFRREVWTRPWGTNHYQYRIPVSEVRADGGTLALSMTIHVWLPHPLESFRMTPELAMMRCFDAVISPLRTAAFGTEARRLGDNVSSPDVTPRLTDSTVEVR